MILTTLEQLRSYDGLHPDFRAVRNALRTAADGDFRKGKTPLDGGDLYLVGLEYSTNPLDKAVFEAHRRCIDVMLVLSGEELVGSTPLDRTGEVLRPYSDKDDALLAESGGAYSLSYLRPGDVAVFFPEDAHAPGLDAGGTQTVRKLVAKVRIAPQKGS